MKYTVTVTQEDINSGMREEPCLCPIALACLRAGIVAPLVGMEELSCVAGLGVMPKEAGTFVANFDEGEPVEPFSFEIEIAPFKDPGLLEAVI